MSVSKLIDHIVELNPDEAKNVDCPFDDWELTDMTEEDDYCACGTPIKFKFWIENQLNREETFVGSKCIERVQSKLSIGVEHVVKVLQRRKKNPNPICQYCCYQRKCRCYLTNYAICYHCDLIFSSKDKLKQHIAEMKLESPDCWPTFSTPKKIPKKIEVPRTLGGQIYVKPPPGNSIWRMGKHKGKRINELEDSYINWALTSLPPGPCLTQLKEYVARKK